MLKSEVEEAIDDYDAPEIERNITLITGEAAYPLMRNIVDNLSKKWHNFNCNVVAIKNNFFGGRITVTGLLTGTDILEQLKGQELGTELLISSSMLRHEGDMFLDSITVEEVEKQLNVKITVVESDGWSLLDALNGI